MRAQYFNGSCHTSRPPTIENVNTKTLHCKVGPVPFLCNFKYCTDTTTVKTIFFAFQNTPLLKAIKTRLLYTRIQSNY